MQLKTLGLISLIVFMLGNIMVSEGSSGIDHRDIFVGASARAVGMGSAFTAGPSANNGFLWNPSSLGFMNGLEVNMGGIPFSKESSGPDQAFSFAASPYTLGITDKNIGNLSVASWFNGWNNSNNKSTQIVLLGYGLALGEQASAGANVRYYQNNTPIRTNYLFSFDFGMQFAYPLERLGDSVTIGMNLSELSNGIREDGELIESLPLAARFGTTYRPDSETLLSADIAIRGQNDVSWGERLRLHFGAERWLFNHHFGVRVGYTTLASSEQFSSGEWTQGISFQNSSGQLDYAHVRGGELGQSLHWISATLRWGGKERHSLPVPDSTVSENDNKHIKDSDLEANSPILMPKTLEPDMETDTPTGILELSESAISPNKDGISDTTTFRFNVRANDKWQLTIHDVYTEQIWEMTGTGSPADGIVWNAIGTNGNLVSDGNYVVQLHIIDAQGKSHPSSTTKVTVDLIPATLEINKKGSNSISVKTWDINPIANWTLEIFDAGNNLVEKKEGNGAPPETVVLNKIPQSADMVFRFAMSVQDTAGNKSFQQVQLQFGNGAKIVTQEVNEKPTLTLMVGSFAEEHNANMLAETLQSLYPNEKVTIYTASVNDRTMHRVTIGEFVIRSDSAVLKQQIFESQGVEPVLITPK